MKKKRDTEKEEICKIFVVRMISNESKQQAEDSSISTLETERFFHFLCAVFFELKMKCYTKCRDGKFSLQENLSNSQYKVLS